MNLPSPPFSDPETISFLGTNKIAVSDILTALNYRRTDSVLQGLLCSKFGSNFDTHDLDFYLPQLCQILIDRGQEANYLRIALLELCRRSLRTGVLSRFYFSAAVEDNLPTNVTFCAAMTKAIDLAATAGSKSQELNHLVQIYQNEKDSAAPVADTTLEKPVLLTPKAIETIGCVVKEICSPQEAEWLLTPTPEASVTPDLPSTASETTPSLATDSSTYINTSTATTTTTTTVTTTTAPATTTTDITARKKDVEGELQTDPTPEIAKKDAPTDNLDLRVAPSEVTEAAVSNVAETREASVTEQASVPTTAATLHCMPIVSSTLEKLDILAATTILHTKNGTRDSLELIENIYTSTKHPRPVTGYVFNMFCNAVKDEDVIERLSRETKEKIVETLKENQETSSRNIATEISNTDTAVQSVLSQEQLLLQLRATYFMTQFRFVNGLTRISTTIRDMWLRTKEEKNEALRYSLKLLGSDLGWLNGIPYRVVRIPSAQAFCLNSRDRVPYMVHVEVVSESYPGAVEPTHKDPTKRSLSLEIHRTGEENSGEESNKEYSRTSKDVYTESVSTTETNPDTTDAVNRPAEVECAQHTTCSCEENFQVTEDKEWVDVPNVNSVEEVKIRVGEELLDEVFGHSWNLRKENMRKASPCGYLKGWDVLSLIVKGGDDLRQEQLAMQIIRLIRDIFEEEGLPLWLNPYMVLATSRDAGLIGTVHDAISIHGLKSIPGFAGLKTFFERAYGEEDNPKFQVARTNFVESLAAYSLILYILQIKDRHNGNILIDREGHIIHIDYGFMLSSSPGNLAFEKAPFKLPLEMVEVMGGLESNFFAYFRSLVKAGFVALRKGCRRILALTELMISAGGGMTCFKYGPLTLLQLEERFQLQLSDADLDNFCDDMVNYSLGNWRTGVYDNFQYYSNGIL